MSSIMLRISIDNMPSEHFVRDGVAETMKELESIQTYDGFLVDQTGYRARKNHPDPSFLAFFVSFELSYRKGRRTPPNIGPFG